MFDDVPDGWGQEPLGAIAEIILGQSPPSSVVNADGIGLPFIQGNAEFGPRSPSPVLFASEAPKKADTGDVLLSVRAPVGEVNVAEGPLCIGRGVAAIRPRACDRDFLFYAVGGLQSAFARLSQGSTFDAINGKELRQLPISIPPLDEQRRIAEVLRSVDDVLDLNIGIEAHLWTLREIALSELFSATEDEAGESTVLGRLPLGWRAAPAEDVCEAVIDCKNRTPPIVENGFAVVRTMNVRRGRFIRHNLARTDAASFDEWTKRGKPKPGDVLITREAPIGEVCAVPADEPVCLGQRMMLYRPRPTDLLSGFLLYALQSRTVQEHLLRLGGGSTVGHVRVGDIRRLPLPLPDLDKQAEICEALADIDEAIDRASAATERLRGLKGTLASDLLSGRVRVPA